MDINNYIKYEGSINGAGIFVVNSEQKIRIILSKYLIDLWHITNESEALQKFAPIFIMARGSRGIVASEYYLTPDNFKKDNSDEVMSYDEAIQKYTDLANSDVY
jgi:hypothetical protein